MITENKDFFLNIKNNGCFESSFEKLFIIYDCTNKFRCFIKKQEIDPEHFTVHNPNEKRINFLAIDNCCSQIISGQRCDFAIFDESTFAFVEIKNRKRKPLARSIARDQLRSTIRQFKEALDFSQYRIEAIMCIGFTFPTPIFNATHQDTRVEFMKNFGAYLMEGNSKTF